MVGYFMDMDEVDGVRAVNTIGFVALCKTANLVAICILPDGAVGALEEMAVLDEVAVVGMNGFGRSMAVELMG